MWTEAQDWTRAVNRPVLDNPKEIAAVVAYVRDHVADRKTIWNIVVRTHAVDLDLLSASLAD